MNARSAEPCFAPRRVATACSVPTETPHARRFRQSAAQALKQERAAELVAADMLPLAQVRAFLHAAAKRRRLVTYREMASALQAAPPNTIHQVTVALERLMEEDAAASRPFIAALAVSATLGDLPRRGFFECAGRLGRFTGDPDGADARTFHAEEVNAAIVFWGSSNDE
jgi:hypothetical protein